MIEHVRTVRRRRLLATLAVATVVSTVGLGVAATAQARPALRAVHYAVVKRVCNSAPAGQYRCMALRLVDVPKGTPGAVAYRVPAGAAVAARTTGPAGGLTPSALASAYGYDPTLAIGRTQTVAIVDAFDDPHALADLNTFDRHYGLPTETTKSFRKVNQYGKAARLPAADKGWSTEIALDIETVRSVCNACRIVLVEANQPYPSDLAQAVNTAARLGATEISNSYGGPERRNSPDPRAIRGAYNHPGIVITASTGDDGWFGWDIANARYASYSGPNTPSSYPTVVAVGGTKLALNADGTRQSERVWNGNGVDDKPGWPKHVPYGASGGGCSWNYAAKPFQAGVAGYAQTGCGSRRLAGDVAALADPRPGFDVYSTYGGNGWLRVGGTSLSSPLIAAMWALAGGSAGVAYPAETLYKNSAQTPTSVYDVTVGGNSFCGGDSAANCSAAVRSMIGPKTGNPNNLTSRNGRLGLLDCGYAYNQSESTKAANTQCNAVPGYDGPSGVGAPIGLSLFVAMQPSVTMRAPRLLKVKVAESFSATNFRDPIPGSALASYTWNWGDGTTTTPNPPTTQTVQHTYGRKGTYRITLTALDTTGKSSAPVTRKYTLGYAPTAAIDGATRVRVRTAHTWRAAVVERNTGGAITRLYWTVNGRKMGTAKKLRGQFTKPGRYRLGLHVRDNSGFQANKVVVVRVTR